MSILAENVKTIYEKIAAAAKKSGRNPEDITLVAATKTVSADRINEAIRAGLTDIGENRVQEFTEKYEDITEPVRRHFIGHLQTNKVKYIIGKVCLIHSAESEKLLDEIERLSQKHGIITDVLIEVNASGEESKFGVEFDDVLPMLENNEKRENVRIRGLMTIGPNYSGEDEIRAAFCKMHELFKNLRENSFKNSSMDFLSMGMSNDFEIAIEEGANIVRVGSAIFGERIYK